MTSAGVSFHPMTEKNRLDLPLQPPSLWIQPPLRFPALFGSVDSGAKARARTFARTHPSHAKRTCPCAFARGRLTKQERRSGRMVRSIGPRTSQRVSRGAVMGSPLSLNPKLVAAASRRLSRKEESTMSEFERNNRLIFLLCFVSKAFRKPILRRERRKQGSLTEEQKQEIR